MALKWQSSEGANYDWDRSISEPDLTDPFKKLSRFTIKHPHEYISVDDLKYFRRKKPPDQLTKSNIFLYGKDETVLPFNLLKSEYRKNFRDQDLSSKPHLLRRSTSLRLEGLMNHLSEHREKYHWYSPNDWKSCRGFPIKNPESLRLCGDIAMDPEYKSSYISYPMVDRTMKILPREMFHIDPDSSQSRQYKLNSKSPEEIATITKLAEDKFKRDVAAQQQQKCHLQQRSLETNYNTLPSEYKRQFVQFPIEKAHSIPQISHIKMQGEFGGVPEYQDSFKMYANYSKSAPIKKIDNLTLSGSERPSIPTVATSTEKPEYREKFCDPPKYVCKEKSLKTDDHLHPQGEFSKALPEYYESFRDPQIKALPERGKCREPYLRLKGKIEFNPEYRNTYLDFPRSRPIVKKPISSFRLPTSNSSTTSAHIKGSKSPKSSPQRLQKSSSQERLPYNYDPRTTTTETTNVTTTPEYRRAVTQYQLRERTPTRKQHIYESDGGGNSKYVPTSSSKTNHKSSDSSFDFTSSSKPNLAATVHKKRHSRSRPTSILEAQTTSQSSFDNIGHSLKKTAKFGRRASVLENAANCREKSSIIEGNPKYSLPRKSDRYERENRESFVVLEEPCKRSNWMKKSWYES